MLAVVFQIRSTRGGDKSEAMTAAATATARPTRRDFGIMPRVEVKREWGAALRAAGDR